MCARAPAGRARRAPMATHLPSLRLPAGRNLTFLLCLSSLPVGLWLSPVRLGVVLGDSMAPGFRDGQVFLMSLWREGMAPKRGDVVVFRLGGQTYLKRVRALPGESIWGLDWRETEGRPDYLVFTAVEADYLRRVVRHAPKVGELVQVRVPPDCVFVVGDAAASSYDSRHFGPVPIRALRGRVAIPSLFALPTDLAGLASARARDRPR